MAEHRRTHAQRKYAQGMYGPTGYGLQSSGPAISPAVRPTALSTRSASSSGSSSVSSNVLTTRIRMNVQELMDQVCSRGFGQSYPTPPVSRSLEPKKKISIPIVKLAVMPNPKKTELLEKQNANASRVTTVQKSRPVRSQPLTRSKTTAITHKALRSRSVTAKTAPAISPPDWKRHHLRAISKKRKSPPTPAPKISPQIVPSTVLHNSRVTRRRAAESTLALAKKTCRVTKTSILSDSSDDETPLMFINKNVTNIELPKPVPVERATSSSSSDLPTDMIPVATSTPNCLSESPSTTSVSEQEKEQTNQEKPSSDVPSVDVNPEPSSITLADSTLTVEVKKNVYDFQEEPPITSFSRKNEAGSQTTDHYIIYGPENKLRCKLNKERIVGLPSTSAVTPSAVVPSADLPTTSAAVASAAIAPSVALPSTNASVPFAVLPQNGAVVPLAAPAWSTSNSNLDSQDNGVPMTRSRTNDALFDYEIDPTLVTMDTDLYVKPVIPLLEHIEPLDNGRENNPRHQCSYEAPTFRPTEADFKDPLAFIQKISPIASKWGICKIIPPTTKVVTAPHLPEDVKFNCLNQYLNRMYMRWGPATRELCAIKTNLARNEIKFDRPPLIDGVEVNLPAFYSAVQSRGGFKEVLEKAKLQEIAEELKIKKEGRKVAAQLDKIYCRYLVTYDALSHADRQSLLETVDREWGRKFKRMVARAARPTHRQRRLVRASASSDSEDEEERDGGALSECEECVTRGRTMSLAYFQNLAGVVRQMYFPGRRAVPCAEAEREFWRLVLLRARHACVYAAAVDSGEAGLGFPPPGPEQPPWNLKVVSDSAGSVLRSLGPVMGLTVPTIHLGMLFSTSCWHRDPHGLPWIEYHHSGAPKIWYGIPDKQSNNFKRAVGKLAPSFCLNKTIWLPSDVLMLPPSLLSENGVTLARAVQAPGELVVVFPKAYTSSVCTGYSVSESVYFGPEDWLTTVRQDFQEVRDSCEPTMFPLEQLLLRIARDPRSAKPVLLQAYSTLKVLVDDECRSRQILQQFRIRSVHAAAAAAERPRADQEECDVCRVSLFLSKVTGISEGQVCSKHAVAILEKRPRLNIAVAELVLRLTDRELNQALDEMEARIFS